jgi:hypothetical protein
MWFLAICIYISCSNGQNTTQNKFYFYSVDLNKFANNFEKKSKFSIGYQKVLGKKKKNKLKTLRNKSSIPSTFSLDNIF